MMTWFEKLFGFAEQSWDDTQSQFILSGPNLTSKPNGKTWHVGTFSTPSLGELRAIAKPSTPSTLSHEIVGDILEIHGDPNNAGAMFQAASQFNTLEFPGPDVTPEAGITGYAHDMTQGPACAIATAPATVFRNYFVPTGGERGQRKDRQINTLADLENAIEGGPFWTVRNGYTDAKPDDLQKLAQIFNANNWGRFKSMIRIGIQSNADVVFSSRYEVLSTPHRVSQAYCSALACGYSRTPTTLWEPLARLILEAAYEATLIAAAIDRDKGVGTGTVWLTLLGGGVFGNESAWIADSIRVALVNTRNLGLDIRLAHFRKIDPVFEQISV